MKPAKVNFNIIRSIFFFGLITTLSLIMIFLIKPFFYPIFWAAVIAMLFQPVYKWFVHHTKLPSLSSFITIILVILIIFIPLTILSLLVVDQSVNLFGRASSDGFLTDVQNAASWLKQTPLSPYIEPTLVQWGQYATDITKIVSNFLITNIKDLTQNSFTFIFMLFLMFYTLFFFLKDGTRMLKKLMHLSPLGDEYEILLYNKFTSTARATLKTTLIVGLAQGTIGGIIFWIADIKGALIWSIVMTIASIIPAFGCSIVWLPIGIIMLVLGHTWQGLMILTAGALVISTIDNIIRPPLIGRDTQMHPLMALFSTLGGIFLFGISGFVIGPVIASLFLSIISIYDFYYKKELQNN